MKAQNRHDTLKWKKRRKHHGKAKCGYARCFVCHSDKVCNIPTRKELRENSKNKNP